MCPGTCGQRSTWTSLLPHFVFALQVVRVGQRIATIDVRLKDAANGALVAQVCDCWHAS